MKQTSLVAAVVAAVIAVSGQVGSAQNIIAQFDENTVPSNPMNGYGSFTFGDVTGQVTDGPDSLIFDVMTDNDGSNGLFGGIGVDFGEQIEIVPDVFILDPIDFDPALAWWRMRVKILENNQATTLNTVYRDVDVLGSTAEEYQFNFDLTSIAADGEFHDIIVQATNWGFMQDSMGVGDDGNNPGLNQIQIQTVYGSDLRTNVEVDFVRIETYVPEPSALVLLGLGCIGLVTTYGRRRSEKTLL